MIVAKCDRCGTTDEDAGVISYEFLEKIGYKCTKADSLAQRFQKQHRRIELCKDCHARLTHHLLTLSEVEKNQIVMLNVMEMESEFIHNAWQQRTEGTA